MMEKKPQAERDRELLAFWLQRRADAHEQQIELAPYALVIDHRYK